MVTLSGLALTPAAGSEDAAEVARLRGLDDPETPISAAEIVWYWHRHELDGGAASRWLGRDAEGRVLAYAGIQHRPWSAGKPRWAQARVVVHPQVVTDQLMADLYSFLVSRSDGAERVGAEIRQSHTEHLLTLERLGWRRDRVGRWWELDLVAARQRLETMAKAARARMAEAAVTLTTWDQVDRPGLMEEALQVSNEAEADVPSSAPAEADSLKAFRSWLDSPGIHRDRIWLALDGEGVAGMSVLKYGEVVWTNWTFTARRARGRGIARALKLETVLQAAGIGIGRVRTENDEENAPILHLNEEIGYLSLPGNQLMVWEAAAQASS